MIVQYNYIREQGTRMESFTQDNLENLGSKTGKTPSLFAFASFC
jgi:hypothetical protein